jgi:serine protease Do
LSLSELTSAQKNELGVKGGLLVNSVRGTAAAKLARGDVILAMNAVEIVSLEQFSNALKKIPKTQQNIALLVQRGEVISYITLTLGN